MDMDLVILEPEVETGAHVLARAVKETQAVVGSLDLALDQTDIAAVLADGPERLLLLKAEASDLLLALADLRHAYMMAVTGR